MALEHDYCTICRNTIKDYNHMTTINHRYNFATWAFQNYRKALVRNRHGIELELSPNTQNCKINFDYQERKGKYIVKLQPKQLKLVNNRISFKGCLKNKRAMDNIYITEINLLNMHNCFQIDFERPVDFATDAFLLLPGQSFNFSIDFTIKDASDCTFKIPFACDIQTNDKKRFTIIRSILVIIDEEPNTEIKNGVSPFTSKPWNGIINIIPHKRERMSNYKYPLNNEFALEGLSITIKEVKEKIKRFRLSMGDHEISVEKYCEYWHSVLWLEEQAQSFMLTKYNMANVRMKTKQSEILVLEVPGLSEKRPSVVDGDLIRIRLHEDHTVYKGLVMLSKDSETCIEIYNVDDELLSLIEDDPNLELDVQFVLSRLAFERMHAGVDNSNINRMVTMLFPKNEHIVKIKQNRYTYPLQDSEFYNKDLLMNSEQKQAVIKILNSIQYLPYIIFGPPGTGKTITIVEAILQIMKKTNKKILVCAPSNSACDNIANRLINYCKKNEMIRVNSVNREMGSMSELLIQYSNIDEENEVYTVDVASLKKYKIVIATLTLIGRYAGDYSPDVVFVDEAAQASEPETDIAIGLMRLGKQLILAGDPKQLGPMVTPIAEKCGLGTSLLERLMEYSIYEPHPVTRKYNNNFITMLKLNFRSHEIILRIPNQLFYDNNLEARSTSAVSDPIVKIVLSEHFFMQKKNLKHNGEAVEFYAVSSKEQREGTSPSFFNIYEVKIVVKYVQTLLNLQIERKVTMNEVGIVTPYKRQVHKIKDALKRLGFDKIEVGTTEAFQGREKRVIIISTVRAQHLLLKHDEKYNLGFVKNSQRFNVAITRAMSKLIVVGCPAVLCTDDKWEMYVDLCRNCSTFFGDKDTPKRNDYFKQDVVMQLSKVTQQDQQYQNE